MRCTGIIAEYNPLHNGHKYHIDKTKALSGGQPIIVAMSGWFVQRGDIACFDPYTRARWALEAGADIVLLLPVSFSLANAERFAMGGVGLLNSTGIVDSISFGTENDDISIISQFADFIDNETDALRAGLVQALAEGKSYPAARAAAIGSIFGQEAAKMLSGANNVLAMEYIKAISRINGSIKPIAVKRNGAQHDSPCASINGSMSASAIRSALLAGKQELLCNAVPASVFAELSSGHYINSESLSQAIICTLRRLTPDELANTPDVAEGLENAIFAAARSTSSFNEMIMNIKSKRYTLARIRRICLNAFLGITKQDHIQSPLPEYIRLIGAKREALPLVGEMAKAANLPIITCRADYEKLDPAVKAAFDFEIKAAEIVQLNGPAVNEFARKFIII